MKYLPIIHDTASNLSTHFSIAFGHEPYFHFEHINVVFFSCEEGLERVLIRFLFEYWLRFALVVGRDEGSFFFLLCWLSISLFHCVEQVNDLLGSLLYDFH
jgi:hypothetical protein